MGEAAWTGKAILRIESRSFWKYTNSFRPVEYRLKNGFFKNNDSSINEVDKPQPLVSKLSRIGIPSVFSVKLNWKWTRTLHSRTVYDPTQQKLTDPQTYYTTFPLDTSKSQMHLRKNLACNPRIASLLGTVAPQQINIKTNQLGVVSQLGRGNYLYFNKSLSKANKYNTKKKKKEGEEKRRGEKVRQNKKSMLVCDL